MKGYGKRRTGAGGKEEDMRRGYRKRRCRR